MPLHDAILEGVISRVRPVVMTALMAAIGLLPAAISTGIGSETQKPLAIVVIGGLITSTFLTLLILPIIYTLVHNFMHKSDNRNLLKKTGLVSKWWVLRDELWFFISKGINRYKKCQILKVAKV